MKLELLLCAAAASHNCDAFVDAHIMGVDLGASSVGTFLAAWCLKHRGFVVFRQKYFVGTLIQHFAIAFAWLTPGPGNAGVMVTGEAFIKQRCLAMLHGPDLNAKMCFLRRCANEITEALHSAVFMCYPPDVTHAGCSDELVVLRHASLLHDLLLELP